MGRDGHLGMGVGIRGVQECRGAGEGDGWVCTVRPDSKTPRLQESASCSQITSLQQEGEELSGQARCPFDATQSTVAIFAGVHLGM